MQHTVKGSLEACSTASLADKQPPERCGAVYRLELRRIDETPESLPARASIDPGVTTTACPEGMAFREGKCAKVASPAPSPCSLGNMAECETKCDRGDGSSCFNLAEMLLGPFDRFVAGRVEEGVRYPDAASGARGAKLYEQACASGLGRACSLLGFALESGTYDPLAGVPQDDARAASFYQKACDANDLLGCDFLGSLYGKGQGVPQDGDRAAQLHTRAVNGWSAGCDRGEGEACYRYGGVFWSTDHRRCVSLLQKACDLGNANGCTGLVMPYHVGEDVPKDDVKSADYARRACDGGSASGCRYYGDALLKGQGVPADATRGTALIQRSCDMGSSEGCDDLAEVKWRHRLH